MMTVKTQMKPLIPHVTARTHRIFICRTCALAGANPMGSAFADRLRTELVASADFGDVEVRASRCMLVCDAPLAVSLACAGKVSYLFAELRPESDLGNLIELIRLYRASPSGAINDARPIGRLRHCLRGRLPASDDA